MGNYNKLCRICQAANVFCKPLHVYIIERGFDLIEHAERRRPQLENRKVQRNSDKRLFTARKQRNRFNRLARWRHADVDTAVQNIRGIGKLQFGVSAAENLAEGIAEVHIQLGELGRENLLHADGQLVDDLAQIGLRGLEVVLLLPQKAVPLLHALKFVHRIQIDVAERPHFQAQFLHTAARFTEVFNRFGNLCRRCGCQLVAFPHFIQNLCFLGFQLSGAVFQSGGLAFEFKDFLVAALCRLFQTDPFALGLFAPAVLPRKLFAEQPGGGVASVLGCTDLGKFISQACDFRRKACDRLLRAGHARVEVGLEPLKLRECACFAVLRRARLRERGLRGCDARSRLRQLFRSGVHCRTVLGTDLLGSCKRLLCGRPALRAGGKCLFILLLRCCEVSLFRNQAVIPFLQAFQQEFMLFYRSSKSGSLLLRVPAVGFDGLRLRGKRFQFLSCSLLGLCQRFALLLECAHALLGGVQAFRPRQCAGAAGDRAACHGTACLQDLSV